jgi:hypothetical protein
MKRLIAVALAILIVAPVFACGPAASNSNSSTSTSSRPRKNHSKRERWAKKRMWELEGKQFWHNLATSDQETHYSTPAKASLEVRREHLHNRFEYLALKQELGRATPREKEELRNLIHLLSRDTYW